MRTKLAHVIGVVKQDIVNRRMSCLIIWHRHDRLNGLIAMIPKTVLNLFGYMRRDFVATPVVLSTGSHHEDGFVDFIKVRHGLTRTHHCGNRVVVGVDHVIEYGLELGTNRITTLLKSLFNHTEIIQR